MKTDTYCLLARCSMTEYGQATSTAKAISRMLWGRSPEGLMRRVLAAMSETGPPPRWTHEELWEQVIQDAVVRALSRCEPQAARRIPGRSAALARSKEARQREGRVDAWCRELIAVVTRADSPCLGHAAAEIIARESAKRWRTSEVASALGCNSVLLRRQFRAEFGLRVVDYRDIVRICQAGPSVASGQKVETVALDLGYVSRKDFYRAFSRWLAMTPCEFRRSPPLQQQRQLSRLEQFRDTPCSQPARPGRIGR